MLVDNPTRLSTLYPPLQPLMAEWIQHLSQQPSLLQQLLQQYGSPLNIHCLDPFLENHAAYQAVFESLGVAHLILFARKANKCQAFAKSACENGFGVDTASYRELEQCLQLGCAPERLVSTAAIKDERLIELAITHQVVLVLDNADEMDKVQAIAKRLQKQALIGIRISGFHYQGTKLYSRFGFDIDEVVDFVEDRFGASAQYSQLDYRGLHFHLDGYSPEQRGVALHAATTIADELSGLGLKTRFIDIGGGFLMNYLAHKEQWDIFARTLRAAVQGEHEPITFNNNGLGYEMIDNRLEGCMKVYPYYNERHQADFLRTVLTTQDENGITAAERAKAADIEIRMEPGRSLLDQTGVTVARVAHRKTDARGEVHVGLEMNMTQMYSSSADFLLDPIFLPQTHQADGQETAVYFTGAYCLERDVLLKRKIVLPQHPEIGDLVVFVNTAGYMMHFFESEAHLFALARNVFYQSSGTTATTADFVEDGV